MGLNLNSFLQSNNSPLVTREKYSPYNIDEQYERGLIQNAQLSDSAINNAKIRNSYRAYSSVVSTLPGDGDTNDIQKAIDDVNDTGEGGIILIRPGTYYPSSPLVLYDNISLVGVDPTNTIIDFSSCGDCSNGCIQILGTNRTSAGTIAVTSGSATVTGTSTTFSDDSVAAGDFIIINNVAHKISSVASNTSLTIVEVYQGNTESGINYRLWNSISNIDIKSLSVVDGESASTAGTGIAIEYANNILISNCLIQNHNPDGINVNNSYDVKVDNCKSTDNTENGITVGRSFSSYFTNNVCSNNVLDGIQVGAITEGVSVVFFTNNVCNSNGSYGMHLFTSKHNVVSGCAFTANDSHGVYIEGSSYNVFTSNNSSANGVDGFKVTNRISVDSEYNTLTSNVIFSNDGDGVEFTSGGNNNNLCHNVIQSSGSGTAVLNNGLGNTVFDNT